MTKGRGVGGRVGDPALLFLPAEFEDAAGGEGAAALRAVVAGEVEDVEFFADLQKVDGTGERIEERFHAGFEDTGGVAAEVHGEEVVAEIALADEIAEATHDEFPAQCGGPIGAAENHAGG